MVTVAGQAPKNVLQPSESAALDTDLFVDPAQRASRALLRSCSGPADAAAIRAELDTIERQHLVPAVKDTLMEVYGGMRAEEQERTIGLLRSACPEDPEVNRFFGRALTAAATTSTAIDLIIHLKDHGASPDVLAALREEGIGIGERRTKAREAYNAVLARIRGVTEAERN